MKKKLLLSVTPSGWAYDLRCKALIRNLKDFYLIEKRDNEWSWQNNHNYDLTYIAGFEILSRSGVNFSNACTTIGGLVLNSMERAVEITKQARALAIPNLTWYNQIVKLVNDDRKIFYITNGVDTTKFKPSDTSNQKKFILGWVGNDRQARMSVKRINILRDVCKQIGVPLIEHNWSHNRIPHDRMPRFYNKISLYVGPSATEGSNNPILEACASGVPVLATTVGNVPELLQSGVIPLKQDLSDLRDKIINIMNMTQESRFNLGLSLRDKMVNEFDWVLIAAKYKEMFDYCMSLEPRVIPQVSLPVRKPAHMRIKSVQSKDIRLKNRRLNEVHERPVVTTSSQKHPSSVRRVIRVDR